MPRRAAISSLTGEAAQAHHAVQNETRLAVLKILLVDGTSSRADITEATGLTVSSVLSAIRDLEEAGYVRTNVDGDRAGRRVEYSVNRTKLTADLFDFMGWLLG